MKILAVDTSSKVASVAISDNDVLLGEYTLNHELTHSQRLLPMADELLSSLNLSISDIDVFAASTGPGSFTGLRIGIATIKGFAFAQSKPTVSVSGLEAMAYNHLYSDYLICPMMDARRSEVYNAIYKRYKGTLVEIAAPRAISVDQVVSELSLKKDKVLFLGDGVMPNLEKLQTLKTRAVFAEFNGNMQRAGSVALCAHKKAKNGEFTDAASLNATYLRKSQAERELNKNE